MARFYRLLSSAFGVCFIFATLATTSNIALAEEIEDEYGLFCHWSKKNVKCVSGVCIVYTCHNIPAGDPMNPSCCYQ